MRIGTIVSICCLALSVVFLALVSVWQPFCLFASLLFLVGIAILAYNNLISYSTFKKDINEQRLVDAYLNQEENPTENMKDFRYDRKTERRIKSATRNQFSSVFSLGVLLIFAIIMVIISIKITFFA